METSNPNNVAVVLVDMQEGFLEDRYCDKVYKMISCQANVLRYCAEHDWPVAVLEYERYKKTIPQIKARVAEVQRSRYLGKDDNNGFTNPDLEAQIQEWDAEHLLLMGINAHACVQATGEGAIGAGFQVSSARDLIMNVKDSDAFYFPWFKENCVYYPLTHDGLLQRLDGTYIKKPFWMPLFLSMLPWKSRLNP